MRWVLPTRTMDFAFVKMAESFSLLLGIENAVLDKFMQTKLQGVLDNTKHMLSPALFVDAMPLEVPKLVSEAEFRLRAVVDAA
jgi:hypothetical protein